MHKLRVHYVPNQTHRVLVAKLERVPKIKGACIFVPLAEEWYKRKPQLEEMARSGARKVFLWGDGKRHHESYWFTRESGIKVKINVDYHDDARARKPADFGSHMFYTKNDGVKIFTPCSNRIIL